MNQLPTGTVTFLFTDIEGSTKLWQQHPGVMPAALSRHHALLSRAITAHNGYVFQIIGDAFCAAFMTASDGLGAALEAQRQLAIEEWGETGAIRVRMALHTGNAEVHAGAYTSGEYVSGLTLSRTSRLLSVGHGGQILLSMPVCELIRDNLPAGVSLRDMGLQRLRDLIRPEHIFQIITDDLPADFPPLKTLDTLPNNLPMQLTSFIGREKEIGEIKEIIQHARLVTLTGVGGSGKTRLAIKVAGDLLEDFSDGVWFVELASLTDPELLPHNVATALGLQLQSGLTIRSALIEYMREKKYLLLIDNCEHMVGDCAKFADELIRACPHLKILSTSREGLGIAGEFIYQVPSLIIPSLEEPSLHTLEQNESARLFIDRALMVQPNFTVTDKNAPALAQICYQLDGIPLAIELAAARINVLSVEQISERLVDCFRLLKGGSRTALPRHQTLQALIDWSYCLLSPAERILFNRLSVFAGGWTLEAVESICAGDGLECFDVLDCLQNLTAKSLVVVSEGENGHLRYRLAETIRQYARDKLAASEQPNRFRDRHLDWFMDFEEKARPKLFTSEQIDMLNRLDAEHDNFRAALEWSIEASPDKGLQLAAGLSRFWRLRGFWFERLSWLNKLLDHQNAQAPISARALPLIARGDLILSQGEYDDAEENFSESLQIYRQLGDEKGIVEALGGLARLSIQQENFSRAGELSRISLELARKIGDHLQVSYALNRYAYALRAQGDRTGADELLKESLNIFTQKVDIGSNQNFFASPQSENPFFSLAISEQSQGNFEGARLVFEDGLVFFRKTGSSHEIAWFLRYLANLSYREGDLKRARALYQEALEIVQDLKDKFCLAHTLDGLAQVEDREGSYEQAAFFARQALKLCEQLGSKPRTAHAQCTLGLTLLNTDLAEAERWLKSSLQIRIALQNKTDIADSLEALAKLNSLSGDSERAIKLFAVAGVLREAISFPKTRAESLASERDQNGLRVEVGMDAFSAAWHEGRALGWEQAIKLALAEKTS